MNTFKNILFVALFFAFLPFANAQKIAHVSLDSIMATMPETKVARDEVQNYLKGFEGEILTMQTELETKYKDYLEKKETMSQPVKDNKEADINQLQKRIDDFKAQAGQDIQRKQAELGAPILQKAKKAIEAVAREGGYKYVLNAGTSNNGPLYSEPSDNIFDAVKKKLESMPSATPTVKPITKQPLKTGNPPKKTK